MKNQNVNVSLFSILTFVMLMTINSNSYGSTNPKIKWEKIEWKRVHPTQSRIKYAISKGRKIVFNRVNGVKSLPDKLKGFQ
jgi:hypothetical protein